MNWQAAKIMDEIASQLVQAPSVSQSLNPLTIEERKEINAIAARSVEIGLCVVQQLEALGYEVINHSDRKLTSEIPDNNKKEITRIIYDALDTYKTTYANTHAIYAAISPYLRTTEPVSLEKCATAAYNASRETNIVPDWIAVAKAVLEVAGIAYVTTDSDVAGENEYIAEMLEKHADRADMFQPDTEVIETRWVRFMSKPEPVSLDDCADEAAREIAGQMKAVITAEGYSAFGANTINCRKVAKAVLDIAKQQGAQIDVKD